MNNQFNKLTGVVYQGRNQMELCSAKEKNGYKSDEWCTFLQAKELGLSVKKGSKGISIFKGFGEITKIDKDGKIKTQSCINGFSRVFNADCLEKYEQIETAKV